MKLLFSSLVFSALANVGSAQTTNALSYSGSCEEQAKCLSINVVEEDRKCNSASCEYAICWNSAVGINLFSTMASAGMGAVMEGCKLPEGAGVDYAGDMAKYGNVDSAEGGCPNDANPDGKGYWDENCIDPESTDNIYGENNMGSQVRFQQFCQMVAPGHTVHFMVHSATATNYDFTGASGTFLGTIEGLTCSGTADVTATASNGAAASASCLPSTSDPNSIHGQTYFPTDDPSEGGTCNPPAGHDAAPEGEECVWSFTAPNYCAFEEGDPTCYNNHNIDTLCPEDGPVVEYYEHPDNPNEEAPRAPIHNIQHNGDGTVTFGIYNPYGDYTNQDISQGQTVDYWNGNDFHDLYVVYDQANEIGNEVCDQETAAGKCASDKTYTAKCRPDGIAIVTVFAAGMDDTSSAYAQITNGVGSDTFQCCPQVNEPMGRFGHEYTSAWTYIIHCECATEEDTRARRRLTSEKFHAGELFESEELRKLHGLN